MKQIVLSIIALCCAPFAMQAQQPQIYTLKSCLEYGLQNNYSLQIVRNEEQVSRNNAPRATQAICRHSILRQDTRGQWTTLIPRSGPPENQ